MWCSFKAILKEIWRILHLILQRNFIEMKGN